MTKVHIIATNNAYAFVEAINNFISNKKVIDIKYQSTTCTDINGPTINDRALIIYEENEYEQSR